MTHNLGMAPYRLSGQGICPPDFKPPPPTESQIPSVPSNPKKRRKTSNANSAANQMQSQPPPSPQDLLPPPLSGYGDTIVASNPFDDMPTTPIHHSMNHFGGGMNAHMHHHMGGLPMRRMSPIGMGSPMGGGGMQCGGSMTPHISNRGSTIGSPMGVMPGTGLGGMSPIGNMGPSISPMGPMGGLSPISQPNSHMSLNSSHGPRSVGSPIPGGSIGSPMNSMGSSMVSAMVSPLGGGSSNPQTHLNNGQMGPPMHSPLGNVPPNHNHMPIGPGGSNRMNMHNGVPSGCVPMPSHQISPMSVACSGPNQMTSPSALSQSNNLNSMNSGIPTASHTTINHQNVPLHHHLHQSGPGGMSAPGPDSINPNMSHGIPMGISGHNHHLVHMGHMNGPGSVPMNGPQGNIFGPKPMPVSAGKIYPPGQPMVFNPQNPNAPPIYPCGLCHKEVNDNDEALFCESGCNFFFHRTCSGMTEAAFQLIAKEIYAEWCCDKCLSSKPIPMVKFKC